MTKHCQHANEERYGMAIEALDTPSALAESNFRVGGKSIQWPAVEVVVVGMAVVVAALPTTTTSTVRRCYAGHHEKA